ncbi:hypothetical protein [Kocuria sp. U4B]
MLDPRSVTAERPVGETPSTAGPGAPGRRPPALPASLIALGAALVLVAVVLGEAWSGVAVDAGFALLTVGAVVLLLESGRSARRARRPGRPAEGAHQEPSGRPAAAGAQHGLAGVHEELDVVDVLRGVAPGQELWWMETFPLTLAGDLDAIHKALRTGVRVRLLLLDPKSPALAARLRDIRHRYGLSPMDLRRGFDTLSHQLKVLGGTDPAVAEHLEVRVYDGLPGAPLFLVLDGAAPGGAQDGEPARQVVRAFSSYYLLDASQDMPYLEWRDGPFADRLRAYVEHKWDEGRVVFPVETGERSSSAFRAGNLPAKHRAGSSAPTDR